MQPRHLSASLLRTTKRYAIGLLDRTRLLRAAGRYAGKGLRILCYHGISVFDEHEWEPLTFMRRELFTQRMRFLKENGFTVLPLGEALRLLDENALPDLATVITFDDGWSSMKTGAHPVLREFGFPCTLYVMSYFSERDAPVYNVAIRYFFWKTRCVRLNLDDLGIAMKGVRHIGNRSIRNELLEKIIDHCRTKLDDAQRGELLERLANSLGIDYEALKARRVFNHLTRDELATLAAEGVDLQLHTRHHDLPTDEAGIEREITDNREFVESIVNRPCRHFCYPSGVWQPGQLPVLKKLDIATATTCEPGLNTAQTDRLLLKRFLDTDATPMENFKAEMYGLLPALRSIRGK